MRGRLVCDANGCRLEPPSSAATRSRPKSAAAPKSAATSAQAADALEAWLLRQPGQKVLLQKVCQFYDQYTAAGKTVKSKGIRPFAADHGQRFQVSGEGHAMAIRATGSPRAGDEERRGPARGACREERSVGLGVRAIWRR